MTTQDLSLSPSPVRIAGIHAVLGSAGPFSDAIHQTIPGAEVVNFVNEEMLQYVNRNGGVDAAALRMFAAQVFHAQESNVDAIVIACNVFAPHLEKLRPFVTVPLVAVDSAMQEKAASIGGRIGVMGTNSSSVPACCAGISHAADSLGISAPDYVDGTVIEAADILVRGDTEGFDRLLAEKAGDLAMEGCSAIVLSQVTMARAKTALEQSGITIPVLTSPEECAKRVAAILSA